MTPTRSYSPSPPSPVPFVPPTASDACRNATWAEYLNEFGGAGFQAAMSFGDANTAAARGPQDRRVPTTTYPSVAGYASTSTSGGPSASYSARRPDGRGPSFAAPPPRRLSPAPMKPNQKRKASPLPSPVAYPMMTSKPPPPSPSMAPFPPSDGVKSVPTPPDLSSGTQVGRWTKREHELFLEGLQRFGKSWKKISSLVHTRTLVQIRTHAQKYLQKQSRAAIKADAKAAEAAMSREPPTRLKAPQQQSKTATAGQLTVQMNAPRVPTMPPRPWKSPRPGDRSSFAPVAFPSSLSTSASMPRTSSRSAAQLNSINRLDQLLQDDSSAIPAFVDEYYTSPTAIEDDLLRPLYTGEQWVPPSATYSNKRRRVETSSLPACSSAPTSSSTAGPVLRPAFPGATFKPLPAPESLSPPGNSPEAHPQRQPAAAAALLAAHETDESTSYTNAWL